MERGSRQCQNLVPGSSAGALLLVATGPFGLREETSNLDKRARELSGANVDGWREWIMLLAKICRSFVPCSLNGTRSQ